MAQIIVSPLCVSFFKLVDLPKLLHLFYLIFFLHFTFLSCKTFITIDCVQAASEILCSFNQVYSMIPSTKSSEYLYKMATGENGMGSKRRERKRAAD